MENPSKNGWFGDPGIPHFSTQRRPQATGNETPFWLFLRVWGGGDVNVPVNLLTSHVMYA